MSDLGTDFDLLEDLTANMATVSGRTCLAQAVGRRLQTPREQLFYDPDYGTDVIRKLGGTIDENVTRGDVEAEALKDERLEDCTAAVSFDPSTRNYSVLCSLNDGEGPFDLVLGVDSVTVEILEGD